MAYGMTILASGSEIPIPVLPEKLEVTTSGKNETATVLELGEVLLLRKKGLRSVSWEGFSRPIPLLLSPASWVLRLTG